MSLATRNRALPPSRDAYDPEAPVVYTAAEQREHRLLALTECRVLPLPRASRGPRIVLRGGLRGERHYASFVDLASARAALALWEQRWPPCRRCSLAIVESP